MFNLCQHAHTRDSLETVDRESVSSFRPAPQIRNNEIPEYESDSPAKYACSRLNGINSMSDAYRYTHEREG